MQTILVIQRDGLGDDKVSAVYEIRPDLTLQKISLTGPFDELIDEPAALFPADLDEQIGRADLVIDHLYHPDLSDHLVQRCAALGVPLIAAGRKIQGADTPATCCTLARRDRYGAYGESFGAPEFEVEVRDGAITGLAVLRGAPCGATRKAAEAVIGRPVDQARHEIGLHTQFHCLAWANPDMFLTNPLHVAGDVHIAALRKALQAAGLDPEDADGLQESTADRGEPHRGGNDE